jgi:plastocyanin
MKKLLQNIFLLFLTTFMAANLLAQPYADTIYVGTSNGTNSANAYFPSSITVNQGDSVLFIWVSGFHTQQCNGGCFANFTLSSTGQKAVKMTSAGTHTYFCTVHGAGMSGTIIVNSVASSNSSVNQKYELVASPNPFEDVVTLTINQGNKHLTSVRVFDLIGKEVAYIDLKNKTSASYTLDFSKLNPGVYFCNVYSESGIVETKKLFRTK